MKRKLSALILVLMLASMLSGCGLRVPRPEVKEGRFNFSVTYEWKGETTTVNGVYVCEYAGLSWALDGGYHRDWSYRVEGDVNDTLITVGTAENGDKLELNLDFYPEYFMSDPDWSWLGVPEPYLTVTIVYDEGTRWLSDKDDVEKEYDAKIITYTYDEPIENSFKIFN